IHRMQGTGRESLASDNGKKTRLRKELASEIQLPERVKQRTQQGGGAAGVIAKVDNELVDGVSGEEADEFTRKIVKRQGRRILAAIVLEIDCARVGEIVEPVVLRGITKIERVLRARNLRSLEQVQRGDRRGVIECSAGTVIEHETHRARCADDSGRG